MLSRRRFDVDEYQAMARAGILTAEDRVEPLDGEIVEMHAIGSPHFSCVIRLHRLLFSGVGGRAILSIQSPVHVDRYSMPEPDVAVLRPRDDIYANALPGPRDILLLGEVSDASLASDRAVKLPLHVRAGIPETWIVDLASRAVEMHREPDAGAYRRCVRVTEGHIAPAAFPDLDVDLESILPPPASSDQRRGSCTRTTGSS